MFYDSRNTATNYEIGQLPYGEMFVSNVIRSFGLRKHAKIVDIGSGTGYITTIIQHQFSGKFDITAIDPRHC